MNVLEMKNESKENKEIFIFFKQLNINDVKKMTIRHGHNGLEFYTYFCFTTKFEEKFVFYYDQNKKIDSVALANGNNYLFLNEQETYEFWIEHLWRQFVDHFNLRIRLMFINETTPWRWNTEFTY